MKLTNAETALLGLLSEKPMYPYQIEQEVKSRNMRFWTDLSMSSIYKLLNKLELEKIVERIDEVSAENRIRKIYRLSKKGSECLLKKIEAMLCEPEHTRWQIDIAAYNSNLLSLEIVRESLLKYRARLQEKIKSYNELLCVLSQSQSPMHKHTIAKRPVFLLQAEIKWVDEFIEQIS